MLDCIDWTIVYTRERTTFGQPVLDNQVVHFTLAELATEIEALRALVYRATELMLKAQKQAQRVTFGKQP